MIYEIPAVTAPLTQGDIIAACPLIYWLMEQDKANLRDAQACHKKRLSFSRKPVTWPI